jgi:hypothetical protein
VIDLKPLSLKDASAKVDTRRESHDRGCKVIAFAGGSVKDVGAKVDTRRRSTDEHQAATMLQALQRGRSGRQLVKGESGQCLANLKMRKQSRAATLKNVGAKVDMQGDHGAPEGTGLVVDMGEVKDYKELPRYMVGQRESNPQSYSGPLGR